MKIKNYTYQNNLIGKKQLRQLLAWSFTNYDSMNACLLADELKYLGFKFATQAGISISIEDLKIPFVKTLILEKANEDIRNAEKIYLMGKITDVERFQKIIDTWSLTSESLKDQIVYYFKKYDPLNSLYIMSFSGARGNLSQVRQLIGMRGLMSDPSGQIMNLPIKKNFREGLTITDYLMSGYGARKGIVDTALKTANSGYLTRRLIDVSQDILIREKDCLTTSSLLILTSKLNLNEIKKKVLGRVLSKEVFSPVTNKLIAKSNTHITLELLQTFQKNQIIKFYVRSPLTCNLYRAICQNCYGWDIANENLIDIGEAIGILAGQSIGEPGTQLTMRTFHTGGIFTSETRQKIISPCNGIIQFYKNLKTIVLRTNRGEDVLVTKDSGSLILVPKNINKKLILLEIARNTIIFPKNNQYILKDTVIGELINTNKQIKIEIKPIVSNTGGEIFIPQLKQKINLLNNNKLIWILAGKFYDSPFNSFINFYSDHKLNKTSYIFRTKIMNHYSGFVQFINNKVSLYEQCIKINSNKYIFRNANLKKLEIPSILNNSLLQIDSFKYLSKISKNRFNTYFQLTRHGKLGTLVSNNFQTLVGGNLYYNSNNLFKKIKKNKKIKYYHSLNQNKDYFSIASYRTIIWLSEEFHIVNCEPNILLVNHGDFISKGFELIPGLLSKTSGLVTIIQKGNIVQTIIIKVGSVYKGKNFKRLVKNVYYCGETLFSNITINELSFCESEFGKNNDCLLIRPIEIYEFPYLIPSLSTTLLNTYNDDGSFFNLTSNSVYSYKSNQSINTSQNLNLVSTLLKFKTNRLIDNNIKLQISVNLKLNVVKFNIIEKLSLPNYILPNLKHTDIQFCFLGQKDQFLSSYTTLGYLETITRNSLEIVKFKVKKQNSKQIFLISNDDCVILNKSELPTKTVNDFISSKNNLTKVGKIIIKNNKFFTIQKGQPYFFPNCKNANRQTNLEYKIIPSSKIQSKFSTTNSISLNYYNILRFSLTQKRRLDFKNNVEKSIKSEFSKFFIKKNGKLYSSLIPQFSKKLIIRKKNTDLRIHKFLLLSKSESFKTKKFNRTILLQSFDTIDNKNKRDNFKNQNYQLALVKFLDQSFTKSSKSIGLYSITEDFFEKDVNSVFCRNTEFINSGKTIGLLNLEKEITGDIVQGLPRIEEILEARKKNLLSKRIPMIHKKGLLVQKTSLDINFEFKKLGTTIKENDRINPHRLLKAYFNYYGQMNFFLCDREKKFSFNRLINNFEGCSRSLKKLQLFILNSVQSVYLSQGVFINDKHLEVIIKQMTTKVLITYEGDTPLLRQEVIDLYHIKYINNIIQAENKQIACYIPLLLGITKAALNNPSFISAASFQETTRVLTKAAIEGRIDWLRGLKENIIIGHLIPSGTGSQNYQSSFKTYLAQNSLKNATIKSLESLSSKSRQV